MDDFLWAVLETAKQCGPLPLIGTFKPETGDLAVDPENRVWVWDGTKWFSKDKSSKTFEEWMGFRIDAGRIVT